MNSGPLAAYRAGIIRDNLGSYLNETFMGRPVMFSDDSLLTLYAQERGLTVQQPTAVVFTAVPEKWSHFSRMYLRWMRGSTIRSVWRMRYLSMALLMPLAIVLAWTALRWLRWYGIVTCARTGWGIRQNGTEVSLGAPAPATSASPSMSTSTSTSPPVSPPGGRGEAPGAYGARRQEVGSSPYAASQTYAGASPYAAPQPYAGASPYAAPQPYAASQPYEGQHGTPQLYDAPQPVHAPHGYETSQPYSAPHPYNSPRPYDSPQTHDDAPQPYDPQPYDPPLPVR
ncbi:hypothetical protein ACOBQB_33515 [Streptomyces sp. G5(2025)]|uniref:hypothetical protein n=1 Tax=Streptomyces sp. G5(2025) TaxID=3406628 RepID=UPI003C22ABB1